MKGKGWRIFMSNLQSGDILVFEAGDNWISKCIRPLAKLSKAVKVANTSDQGKAKSKAISAVAVTFR